MGEGSVRLLCFCKTLLILCLFYYAPLHAASEVTEIQLDNVQKGTVALGFGRRFGDTPYEGVANVSSLDNENSSDLVPIYYYEGEYLFAHGTSFGIHLLDNDQFEVDLVSRYRFDRIEASDDPLFAGLEDRRQSLDAGVAFKWKSD